MRRQEGLDPGHRGRDAFWQSTQHVLGCFPLLLCLNILAVGSLEPSQIPASSSPAYGFYSLSPNIVVRACSSCSSSKDDQAPSWACVSRVLVLLHPVFYTALNFPHPGGGGRNLLSARAPFLHLAKALAKLLAQEVFTWTSILNHPGSAVTFS